MAKRRTKGIKKIKKNPQKGSHWQTIITVVACSIVSFTAGLFVGKQDKPSSYSAKPYTSPSSKSSVSLDGRLKFCKKLFYTGKPRAGVYRLKAYLPKKIFKQDISLYINTWQELDKVIDGCIQTNKKETVIALEKSILYYLAMQYIDHIAVLRGGSGREMMPSELEKWKALRSLLMKRSGVKLDKFTSYPKEN